MDFEFKLHVQVTSIKAQTELGPMYSTSLESKLSYILEYFILVSFDSLEEIIRKYSVIYESSDSMLVEYMGPSSVWALMLVT